MPQYRVQSTELVHFRKRIGKAGFEQIFQISIGLHGDLTQEDVANIDTTVHEKNITYPTDSKLAIKIINRLNKLAKAHGFQQRRTYVKEVKSLRLSIHTSLPKCEEKSQGQESIETP